LKGESRFYHMVLLCFWALGEVGLRESREGSKLLAGLVQGNTTIKSVQSFIHYISYSSVINHTQYK